MVEEGFWVICLYFVGVVRILGFFFWECGGEIGRGMWGVVGFFGVGGIRGIGIVRGCWLVVWFR